MLALFPRAGCGRGRLWWGELSLLVAPLLPCIPRVPASVKQLQVELGRAYLNVTSESAFRTHEITRPHSAEELCFPGFAGMSTAPEALRASRTAAFFTVCFSYRTLVVGKLLTLSMYCIYFLTFMGRKLS